MIFVYIILLSLLGISLLELLDKLKVINLQKLTKLEYISIAINIGLLTFSLYMQMLAFLNIKFNYLVLFIPIFINAIIAIILLIKRFKQNKFLKLKEKPNKIKKYLKYSVNALLILMFVFIFVEGYANYMEYPDEFSYWGLQPKAFFITKSLANFNPHYPNFMPSLTAGYYFFINKIVENGSRIIQAVLLLTNFGLMYEICKRRGLNLFVFKLLFLVFILFYPVFIDVSTSLYTDIAFMSFYSLGTIYLLLWIFFERDKNNLFLSIIFTIMGIWVKKDGMPLTMYMYLYLITFKIFNKQFGIKKIKIKDIFKFILPTLGIYIMWFLYKRFYIPTVVASGTTSTLISPSNFIPMLMAMKDQILNDIMPTIILIGILTSLVLIIPKMNKIDKIYNYSLISFIFINICFLMVCYLTVFGGEGLTAASFIRYMSREIPIYILLTLEILKFKEIDSK